MHTYTYRLTCSCQHTKVSTYTIIIVQSSPSLYIASNSDPSSFEEYSEYTCTTCICLLSIPSFHLPLSSLNLHVHVCIYPHCPSFFILSPPYSPLLSRSTLVLISLLLSCSQATLNSGLDLKQAVSLPEEEEYNDWIAVHVVDFFNRINVIYGTVQDFCTDATCPLMSGGPKFEYYWADETQKKPQAVSAPTVSICLSPADTCLSACLSVYSSILSG